jgi:Ras-related protein Rap-1A/Ras-related protein Rap-1B
MDVINKPLVEKKSEHVKISVLGKGNVGKSSLTYKFINYNTPKIHDPTIEDKYKTVIEINGTSCEIDILDTAGQDDYQNLLDSWINFADGFLLIYAINDKESIIKLEKLRDKILKIKRGNVPIVIVGNKCDLENERVISDSEAKELANLWGATYIETSAEVMWYLYRLVKIRKSAFIYVPKI